MNYTLLFEIVLVGVVFAYLWRAGQLTRFADYVAATREELKKCTWPTWAELKGSTIVVILSIAMLGGFTMALDGIFHFILVRIS